jgi:hypothetical protein
MGDTGAASGAAGDFCYGIRRALGTVNKVIQRKRIAAMEIRERMRLALIALARLMDADEVTEEAAVEQIATEYGVDPQVLAAEYTAA